METVVLHVGTLPDASACELAGVSPALAAWPFRVLACVSVFRVIHDGHPQPLFELDSYSREKLPEKDLIERVDAALAGASEVITYHGNGHDLPVLQMRTAVAGAEAPRLASLYLDGTMTRQRHMDLLDQYTFGRRAPPASLEDLCAALRIPMPRTQDAEIVALASAGDWKAIEAHCEAMVVATWITSLFWRSAVGHPNALKDWGELQAWLVEWGGAGHLMPYAQCPASTAGGEPLGIRPG